MNREDIIRMARDISNTPHDAHTTPDLFGENQIVKFFQAAYAAGAAAERAEVERLKLLCEEMLRELYVYRASEYLKDVTASIRARIKK